MSLAVFDISKCIENGMVIEPVHENTTGTIRYVSGISVLPNEGSENLFLAVTPSHSNVLLNHAPTGQ